MNNGESQNAAAVRRQLVELVQRHGPELLDDSRRVRAMLADAVAGATAEANLVGLALSSGVPAKLRDAARDPGRAGTAVADTASELERTSSVQAADARWAVGAIAEALGISAGPATAPMGGGTAPATAPRPPAASAASPGPGRPGPGLAGPNDLTVRVAGQEHVVVAGSVFTFGRDPVSTLVLESTAVSRQHGRVQQGSSGWEYVDLDSTQGSFVDGARVRTHPLRGETVVVLGQGAEAVQVRLSPFGQANTVLPPGGAGSGRAAATELPQRPGGVLGSAPSARTELGGAGGPVLTVTLGSATRTVAPGGSLTIGRETDNDLVATATTVSRHHVTIEGASGGWRLRDLGSTSGTWLNGSRITEVDLSGRQQFVLGDLDKGDRLVTEAPAGATGGIVGSTGAGGQKSGKRGRWSVPVLAAAAVALILLVTGGFFVVRALDDDGGTPAAGKLTNEQLAQGTVLLSSSIGSGSGTVIDKKLGLILTNAHVVAPAAVGSAISNGYQFFSSDLKNPTSIEISVARGIGKPAVSRFVGEVVAADGYLDLAVVKITGLKGGGFVEDADLEELVEVPIGDSDDVRPGDELRVFGYPASQESLGPEFGRKDVSGYAPDERVATNQGWINSTEAIAHGNSGGLAANEDGELVGVPSLLRFDNLKAPGFDPDYTTAGSGFRPVNLAKGLIDAARDGKPYKSKYAVPAGSAKVLGLHDDPLVEPADPHSISGACNSLSDQPESYGFAIDYENFPGGDHTDVAAVFSNPDTGEVLDWAVTSWKTALPKKGCMVISTQFTALPDKFQLDIAVGGDLKPIWSFNYE